MLPALVAEPAVDLVAVASRTPQRAREFAAAFDCAAVTGYEALLDRADIDAVYVPLPAGLHADWVRAALQAGKHVLVEKPAVTRQPDAVELVALAERRGLALMESFMFLHHSQHATVRRLVEAGAIGRVLAFTCDFGIPPRPAGDIRNDPRLGGGALNDIGVYPLRASRLFLGPDLHVVGATSVIDERHRVDVAGAVLLRGAAGASAQLAYGFRHSYRSAYALWGDGGRLELSRAFTPPAHWLPVVRLERADLVEERLLAPDDQFGNVVRAFDRAVREGPVRLAEGAEILRQAELVEAVRAAA
ncbi:oxidoreductase [Dactylosporangium sucinum]|uniref:Oxidoreductase n=2 Tax=Dactylosporangium sucinum TaxID=1424081 RepID=A0A917UFB5_9ACTN|nr:oxidoreductase [Dactylosporangium sucinum]